jgi:hypothetical protein
MRRAYRAAAATVIISTATAAAPPVASIAEDRAPMIVKVVPRSESGVFRDTAVVYLDGAIDDGAPDRLSNALDGIDRKIAVWLNSPGGNLFAGMQLGRIMRKHGASTHIVNYRTLLPGECYSACSLAFLGGVYRFNDNGARYGVHRQSLAGSSAGARDLAPDLTGAIRSYVRQMGVDARLLDLWMKAASDEMYLLSQQQAKDLRVVNDGRMPPEWSTATSPGGPVLQGQQATADGSGTVYFSCDNKQTVLRSVYETGGRGEAITARGWSHSLTIDGAGEFPLEAQGVSDKDGFVRSTFVLPANLVRLARAARQIGHHMTPSSGDSPSIGYRVDIDDKSAPLVRNFLGNCLRRQAK